MGNCLFLRRGAPPSSGPPKPGKLLNEYTWEEISYISSNGLTEEFGFQAGDAKEIILNGTVGILNLSNFTTYAYIIGINHNAAVEGSSLIHFQVGKSALTGGVDVVLVDSYYMNNGLSIMFNMSGSATPTNEGGWEGSFMRNNICGTSLTDYPATSFLAVLPDDLRAVLKPVTKYTNNIGDASYTSAITATTDYLFLLSEYEITGSTTLSNKNEANHQQRYDYYSGISNFIKYRYDNPNTAVRWWLRSPNADSSNRFLMITQNSNGEPLSYGSSSSYGFTPCFCV